MQKWTLLIKYARLGGHSQFVNDPLLIIIEIVQSAVHNQIPPMHTRAAFNPLLVNPIQYARGHGKTTRVTHPRCYLLNRGFAQWRAIKMASKMCVVT